jgi:hypothetical protein
MLCVAAVAWSRAAAADGEDVPLKYDDPKPQRYDFAVRASAIDPRVKAHPEIGFLLEKDGKPQDNEGAAVDTRIAPRGRLVVWLMGGNGELFNKVTGYGLHAIHVHYARGWFDKFGDAAPPGDTNFLGKIRVEATTGIDASPLVDIPEPDGMMERAHRLVKWLAKKNPQAKWDYFLTPDGKGLRWDRVIICGASHGATSAARFAKAVRVDRVVCFCGPRDQYETWQGLPSATPENRYFAFSHVLDGGWTGGHYCRSWELMGLQQFGPIVNVDQEKPPYGNTRRLITAADVGKDPNRAHGSVTPGRSSPKDASGKYLFDDVWTYLFTHPVEEVGKPVPGDPECLKDLPKPKPKPKAKN